MKRCCSAVAVYLACFIVGGAAAGEPPIVRREVPFALGVEYMAPGLAEIYARTGVKWAKAMGTGFTWGEIEPNPPVNGKHTYNWTYTDKLILEYQRAGFQHFHIYVKCRNPWASSKPLPLGGKPSFLPKPEYMNYYADYLRAMVERYDKDGKADAPGLLYPVKYWEIEAEWGTFWPGTAEEYLTLLKVARDAVRSADPNAKIILAGFFFAGVFEANPNPADWERVARQRYPLHRVKSMQKGVEDVKKLLAHPELFDVVEFHSLSDWTEIIGMSRFLRELMRANGYEKPVWVGDVNFTASPLMFWGEPVPPYTAAQKPEIEKTLRALANPRHPDYKKVEAWFRAEQAAGLVKKVVLAMAEGLAGINIGNLEDWGALTFAPGLAGTGGFHGMIDKEATSPKIGEPRPAYHALALTARKLMNFSEVKNLGIGKGVYAYQFTVNAKPLYVLWYDDGKRYLPGDTPPTTTVELRVAAGNCRVTPTPTERGIAEPRPQILSSAGGFLKLELSTVPLFVEPAE